MKNYFKPITRRKFLKAGVASGAVIATSPIWRLFSFSAPPSDFYVNPAVNLSHETLEKLLTIALQRGGEFAEIYVEYTVDNTIALEENEIHNATRSVDMGVGIRLIHSGKTGYSYSDELSFETLKQTAKVASLIASGSEVREPGALKPSKVPSYYLVYVSPDSIIPEEKAKLLWKANSAGRRYDKRITQVNVKFLDTNKKIIIANSEGKWVEDVQTLTHFSVEINAVDGARKSRGHAFKIGTLGYEHYDLKVAEGVAKDAGRRAVAMLPAEDAPYGEYPVVMAKGHCGTFFHEAVGHGLEGGGKQKGEMIASEITSLADDGTIPGAAGTVNVDDEGTPGQKTILIDKGKCINFLFDRLSARRMNAQLTGNGRRESYKHYPLPRMTNIYLMAGQDNPEDIVRSVKKGVYVARIWGGSAGPRGFSFNAPEPYLIEEGKITQPLKTVTLLGKSSEVMKNIVMVGPDLEIWGGGRCGKRGQWKVTSDGNPTLKISNIAIAGSKTQRG